MAAPSPKSEPPSANGRMTTPVPCRQSLSTDPLTTFNCPGSARESAGRLRPGNVRSMTICFADPNYHEVVKVDGGTSRGLARAPEADRTKPFAFPGSANFLSKSARSANRRGRVSLLTRPTPPLIAARIATLTVLEGRAVLSRHGEKHSGQEGNDSVRIQSRQQSGTQGAAAR